ncbi:MAG: YkgJ family cysteine cluster protein [Archangium sp.]|nr:YkgJ family cysteine cluster protein [Archangium sp.]MDP3153355.1 YkgJ family cysteine cluster protein [Archangium sp.]MDP3573487.1 YkgJ family cysteine cluster protein [Archangium sp.]
MTLSALCVECGLCCDGTLFRFLPVEPHEVAQHEALNLPVVNQSGRLAMRLPCSKLEARCCTVYKERPGGCRKFVCHLGHRLEQGEVEFPKALELVREAQRRLEVLRTTWPGPEPVLQRATQQAARGKSPNDASLTALESVHDFLDEWIHWPDGPRTGI